MKSKLALMFIFVFSSLFFFSKDQESKAQASPQKLSTALNSFAFNLYPHINEKDKNLFYSPLSISQALALLANGALGKTQQEILKALHWQGSLEELNQQLEAEQSKWNVSQKGPRLDLANSIWVDQSFALDEAYKTRVQKALSAQIESVDFQKNFEANRQKINIWVEEKTQKKIKEIAPAGSINSLTRAALVNAVYFKAFWDLPFDKKETQARKFWVSEGKAVSVPTMKNKASFPFFENEEVQIVELPYKSDQAKSSVSFIIALPKKKMGVYDLEKKLSEATFKEWTSKLHYEQLELYFPKIHLEKSYQSLGHMLQGLGIQEAFGDQADFRGMSERQGYDIKVSKAIHKTFLELNEEYTEAAAATGIFMEAKSAPPLPPKIVRVDHPFLFFISEKNSGQIYFMGKMMNPLQKE